jgi:copper chaperone NosL
MAIVAAIFGALPLSACNDQKAAERPPSSFELTASAIGHYCGMNVLEHSGPKGQIILASRKEPVWFSSARDTLSFTMLPEEPKDIRAIYVSDMGKAPSWEKPGTTNWTDARQAAFVIGSRMRSGMGAHEAVPFSDRSTAETFVRDNGGRVVGFAEVPKDYVLSTGNETSSLEDGPRPGEQQDGHGSASRPKSGHAH